MTHRRPAIKARCVWIGIVIDPMRERIPLYTTHIASRSLRAFSTPLTKPVSVGYSVPNQACGSDALVARGMEEG